MAVSTKGMLEKDLQPPASPQTGKSLWRWYVLPLSAPPSNDFETETSEQGTKVVYYFLHLATSVLAIPRPSQKTKQNRSGLKRFAGAEKVFIPTWVLLLSLILKHVSDLSRVPAKSSKYQPWKHLNNGIEKQTIATFTISVAKSQEILFWHIHKSGLVELIPCGHGRIMSKLKGEVTSIQQLIWIKRDHDKVFKQYLLVLVVVVFYCCCLLLLLMFLFALTPPDGLYLHGCLLYLPACFFIWLLRRIIFKH